jgi:hypothetical protein
LHGLHPVDDGALEMGRADQCRQVIAAQIASPVVARAEAGQAQVTAVERRTGWLKAP